MSRAAAIFLMGIALAFSAGLLAQEAKPQGGMPAPADSGASAGLAANTMIQAELTKGVDAKKAKPGDPVTAKTTSNVSGNGGVVIPRGSKLTGRVVEAKPYVKGSSQSSLSLLFDRAVLKHNHEVPLHLVIQAMAPPAASPAAASADESDSVVQPEVPGPGGGLPPPMTGAGPSRVQSPGANRNAGLGGVTNLAGGVAGSVAPVDVSGHLSTRASGALGLGGITLSQDATQGSVLTSSKGNVRLESGTQLVLRVVQ